MMYIFIFIYIYLFICICMWRCVCRCICMCMCICTWVIATSILPSHESNLTGSSCYTMVVGSQALRGDGRSQEGLRPYGGAKFAGVIALGWCELLLGEVNLRLEPVHPLKYLELSWNNAQIHTYIHTYIQTDRQTDRQTDGQTDRQMDRQTDKTDKTDRQTDRQTDRHACIHAYMHTCKHKYTCIYTYIFSPSGNFSWKMQCLEKNVSFEGQGSFFKEPVLAGIPVH